MVSDFGIARVADQMTVGRTGEIVGTPAYMSPEQIAGGTIDGRSDLYSLGATVFYALAGRVPFEGAGMSVLAKHVSEAPPPVTLLRPDVSRTLGTAVDRCLAKEPVTRFASGEELAEALGTVARSADVPVVLRRFARGVRILGHELCAQVALVVTLVIGLVVAARTGGAGLAILPVVAIAGVAMMLALNAARLLRVVERTRDILRAGLRFEDAQAVLPGGVHAESHAIRAPVAFPQWKRVGVGMAAAIVTLIWYHLLFDATARLETSLAYAVVGLLLAVPLVAARWVMSRVVLRPDTAGPWNNAWRGWMGRRVFALAATRIARGRAVASVRPPEVLVASAAQATFEQLPIVVRHRIDALPPVLHRLVTEVGALRQRSRDLDLVLRESEALASATPDMSDRRKTVAAEVVALRADLDARASRKITLLEGFRLELLRLRSGLGQVEDVLKSIGEAQRLEDGRPFGVAAENVIGELATLVDRTATRTPS